MLLPGHPGGVSWYEQYFWNPADICDLRQHGDLYTETFLGTPKQCKFQNYDIGSRSPPSSLICAEYIKVKLVRLILCVLNIHQLKF